MARRNSVEARRHTAEQMIRKLREVDRLLGAGKLVAEVSKELGISEHTFGRWRTSAGHESRRRQGVAPTQGQEWPAHAHGPGPGVRYPDLEESRPGKLLRPARRDAVRHVREQLGSLSAGGLGQSGRAVRRSVDDLGRFWPLNSRCDSGCARSRGIGNALGIGLAYPPATLRVGAESQTGATVWRGETSAAETVGNELAPGGTEHCLRRSCRRVIISKLVSSMVSRKSDALTSLRTPARDDPSVPGPARRRWC